MKEVRLPNLLEIIILLFGFLALVLSFTVFLDLPIQLALFISWFIAIILGVRLGHSYKDLQASIVTGISNGLEAVLILVSVGALIGTWIAGGVVPTLIYYGLEFINPHVFLLATLVICSVMSVATGTSWEPWGPRGSPWLPSEKEWVYRFRSWREPFVRRLLRRQAFTAV